MTPSCSARSQCKFYQRLSILMCSKKMLRWNAASSSNEILDSAMLEDLQPYFARSLQLVALADAPNDWENRCVLSTQTTVEIGRLSSTTSGSSGDDKGSDGSFELQEGSDPRDATAMLLYSLMPEVSRDNEAVSHAADPALWKDWKKSLEQCDSEKRDTLHSRFFAEVENRLQKSKEWASSLMSTVEARGGSDDPRKQV